MFNEDVRVKIPGAIHFMRLGYEYQSLKSTNIDRESRIFKDRFKKAIEKINGKSFDDTEINSIIKDILFKTKNNDLGREFYNWLINPQDKVKLIDFDNIDNNDFAVVTELSFSSDLNGSFRPDITVLINGIPLAFLEVKKPNNEGGIQSEFNRMINKRLNNPEYKKYFNMLQIVSFSNNMEYEEENEPIEGVKAGSFYTTPNGVNTGFSFFREEEPKQSGFEEIDDSTIQFILKDNGYHIDEIFTPEFHTNLSIETPCNKFISSLFDKERFFYFLRYGIMYVEEGNLEKHIMRYPQFFATRKILDNLKEGKKGGVVWHTQGSGKTALAAYANRVIKDYYAKKNINTRFYFVVDRLDLYSQSGKEFLNRGFDVKHIESKDDFVKEMSKPLHTKSRMDSIGDFVVVNIQRFEDNIPCVKNEYNSKIQRIFFVDEAHRSYKTKGQYYKNLTLADDDAIFIALTGTPLLSKKERSNLKFGDYIHKYFYDKSISDGYTLKIKKESIDTAAKKEIKKNLDLEVGELKKEDIYESDDYIKSLGRFIDKDFINFRNQNADKTIGGMIVCRSNKQAKKMQEWFKANSKLKTRIVITDESIPSKLNTETQNEFKYKNSLDILIVHQMLTTGYDVKRLKKMYLLRNAKEHTLLQTISRVNRPYISPNGKRYQYGYITDFVDIESEYDKAIDMYLHELSADIDDEEFSLKGLVIGQEEINQKYQNYQTELNNIFSDFNIDIENTKNINMELISKALISMDETKLRLIRRLLNNIDDCYTEFMLSRAIDYSKQINTELNKKILIEVNNRINFVKLKTNVVDTLDIITNKEIVDIVYEFIKTKISIMDLKKYELNKTTQNVLDVIHKIQKEIKNNKDKSDIKISKLEELLQRIFESLEISDLSNLNDINEELLEALDEIKRINKENERISEIYDGDYAFVKTYNEYTTKLQEFEKEDIELLLKVICDAVEHNRDILILQGREGFSNNVKLKATPKLLSLGIFKKLNLKDWYTDLLNDIYTNLQLYK